MKIVEENVKEIEWNIQGYGQCQATIVDGRLTDFRFCRKGSLLGTLNTIYANDVEYLKKVREIIEELLGYLATPQKERRSEDT